MSRRRLLLLVVVGCQASAPPAPAPTPAPAPLPARRPTLVEVRDAKGAVVASVRSGPPCRATFGTTDLTVGGSPLATQSGAAKWTVEHRENGEAMLKDGEMVARVASSAETNRSAHTDVVDPKGVALVRFQELDKHVAVTTAGGVALRRGSRSGDAIAIGDDTITGTDDLQLAALVAANEIPPEVRALAACAELAPDKVQ